jgi:hypothetical protein
MGFASFESMGYGLVALIHSGGQIGVTEEVLATRGLLCPAGDAAWTGLVCAALWRVRAGRLYAVSHLWIPAAYIAAVTFHAEPARRRCRPPSPTKRSLPPTVVVERTRRHGVVRLRASTW